MSEDKTECKLPDPIKVAKCWFYCDEHFGKRVITYDEIKICECQAYEIIAWLNNAMMWCKDGQKA